MPVTLLLSLLLLPTLFLTGSAGGVLPAEGAGGAAPPSLTRWRARDGGFAGWQLNSLHTNQDGTIRFAASVQPCAPDIYCGEALSPELAVNPFEEAIVSWNIDTPPGTWVDIYLRVRVQDEWSEWKMGTWTAESNGAVRRQSWAGQSNEIGRVAVDTLILNPGATADVFQVRLTLLSSSAAMSPVVRAVGVALSGHPPVNPPLSDGNPTRWGKRLEISPCSQMVYPDGGEIWCSPTSVSMVLRYWRRQSGEAEGNCEESVREAVAGVYDYVYEGHGNWPFNVAYVATHGLEGYVVRLSSLEEAEGWIARGIPLVLSYGWEVGDLDGAPLARSAGHLAVLSGFTESGDPIVHDPAAPDDESVPRTYRRNQFERLWLRHSAGTAYLVAPPSAFDMHRAWLPVVSR